MSNRSRPRSKKQPLNWLLLKLHLSTHSKRRSKSHPERIKITEEVKLPLDKLVVDQVRQIPRPMPHKSMQPEVRENGHANGSIIPCDPLVTKCSSTSSANAVIEPVIRDRDRTTEPQRPLSGYTGRRTYRSVAYRTWKVGCARQLLNSTSSDYSLSKPKLHNKDELMDNNNKPLTVEKADIPSPLLSFHSNTPVVRQLRPPGSSSAIDGWNRCFSSQDHSLNMQQEIFTPPSNGLVKTVCYSDQQLPTNSIDCYSAQDYCNFKTMNGRRLRCSTSTDDEAEDQPPLNPAPDLDDSIRSVMQSFQDLQNCSSLPRLSLRKQTSLGSNRLSRRKGRASSGDGTSLYKCHVNGLPVDNSKQNLPNGLPHKRSSSTGSAVLMAVNGKPPLPPHPNGIPSSKSTTAAHEKEGKAKHFIKNLFSQGLALTSPARIRRRHDLHSNGSSPMTRDIKPIKSNGTGVPAVIIHTPSNVGHFSPPARLYQHQFDAKPAALHRTTTVPLPNHGSTTNNSSAFPSRELIYNGTKDDSITHNRVEPLKFPYRNGHLQPRKDSSMKELNRLVEPLHHISNGAVRSASNSPYVFRSWNEAYLHLKQELDSIRARDMDILSNLQVVQQELRGAKPTSNDGVSPIVEVPPGMEKSVTSPEMIMDINSNNNNDSVKDSPMNCPPILSPNESNGFPSFFNMRYKPGEMNEII